MNVIDHALFRFALHLVSRSLARLSNALASVELLAQILLQPLDHIDLQRIRVDLARVNKSVALGNDTDRNRSPWESSFVLVRERKRLPVAPLSVAVELEGRVQFRDGIERFLIENV